MVKIILTSSFRGGTGKSTILSNLGLFLARSGKRVLFLDTDVNSPGVHAMFGLRPESFDGTFTDFLYGRISIEDATHDISEIFGLEAKQVLLIPSSLALNDIASHISAKHNNNLLRSAITTISEKFDVDYLLIDTHPGINEEMLLASALADVVISIVRPDNQDYQGVSVSLELAKRLKTKTFLLVNKVHKDINRVSLKNKIEKFYGYPVAGILPFSEDILLSESKYIFAHKRPTHPFSKEIARIGAKIFEMVHSSEHVAFTLLKSIAEMGVDLNVKTLEEATGINSLKLKEQLRELLDKKFIRFEKMAGVKMMVLTTKGQKYVKLHKVGIKSERTLEKIAV